MTRLILILLLISTSLKISATHIVGGDLTYRCLGNNNYEFTLELFRDCIGGSNQALSNDNPAALSIYQGNALFWLDSNINSNFQTIINPNFSNSCINNPPPTCLNLIVFKFTRNLPPSNLPYTIIYQRCCRNESINNILNPGGTGATYSCTIPASNIAVCNNSAVFKNDPPQIICVNNPLLFDHGAIDIDGDSLSYEFCNAYEGGSDIDPKPTFLGFSLPFIGTVNYRSPFSALNPLGGNPILQINPTTGLVTGTPNLQGRYVVNVCCNEWRNGNLINTVKREFQFVVTNCSKAVIANIPQLSEEANTFIVDCKDYTVNFINQSSGGFDFKWDFGVLTNNNDTSTLFQPSYTYPDTGTYVVKLVVNAGSTCPDSISRLVKIYPSFETKFTHNGLLCPDQPHNFIDQSTSTLNAANYWLWNFDDNTTSNIQNPSHIFSNVGKNYIVTLISGNSLGCRDTSSTTLNIPKVNVFAGNDTVIVKGTNLNLRGTGAQTYAWTPPTFLNNSFIFNPTANFPNAGLYPLILDGITANGCAGKDTILITVSEGPYFNVPTAFSPNGDGINDFLKILNSGYSKLNYFRIFDRWGKKLFETTDFREGWNGFLNNRRCDIGTYFWVISVKAETNGSSKIFKGDVSIIE